MLAAVKTPIKAAIKRDGIIYFITPDHRHGWYDPLYGQWNWAGYTRPPVKRRHYDYISNVCAAWHWTTCWRLFHPTHPTPRLPGRELSNLIDHPLNSVQHTPLEYVAKPEYGMTPRALAAFVIQVGIATACYVHHHSDEDLLGRQYIGPVILANVRDSISAWLASEESFCDCYTAVDR